ncbi:hypothetical protein BDV18DRAFT_133623 [Aspergillus unguis]
MPTCLTKGRLLAILPFILFDTFQDLIHLLIRHCVALRLCQSRPTTRLSRGWRHPQVRLFFCSLWELCSPRQQRHPRQPKAQNALAAVKP